MNQINISIANLIATAQTGALIVSDNTGYEIQFDFDADWDTYPLKTAVFVWYRESLPYCQTVAFSGSTVAVPQIPAISTLYVGVSAGDLQTTTPAQIKCSHSILSSGGTEPEAPTESEYAQLMELLNNELWDKLNKSGASAYELAVQNGYEGSEQTWLASLKGSDGYSPVRGVDYWTEDDEAAMEDACNDLIVAQLAQRTQLAPEFANDIEECTDTTKLYVLPDGYIYGYIKKTSTATGSNNNLAAPTGSEWLTDYRMNSSGGGTACENAIVTNYIALTPGDVVRVKGLDLISTLTSYASAPKQAIFDGSKNVLSVDVATNGGNYWSYEAVEDVAVFTVNYSTAAYMRFSGELADGCSAADVIITVNEEITVGAVTTSYQWANTGHAFVPADYEDRICDVESMASYNAGAIAELESAVEALEDDTVALPAYWQDAVEEAITKVKDLQDAGGSETVQFMLFSDLHYGDNNARIQYVGKLCAAVMRACHIPLAVNCGDTMTSAALTQEDALLTYLEAAEALLAPIGSEGLLQVRGNHDDVWGSYTADGTTAYYVNKVAPAKVWNRFHRQQAKDLRRVFGGDGTYFYLDNGPQKIRFICLNAHFYDGDAITEGTAKNMTTGFGTAQLDWLENVALDLAQGWSAVIMTHVPPTAQLINGNTYYLSQYSDGTRFRSIIQAAEGIIGIFCGHCHADAIVTGDLPCPIITVTTAGGSPYDSTEATRTAGTTTETAIDVVSINKADQTINMTRIGVGSDRSCTY